MPNLPVPILNDVAVQNNATGAVDYLQYQGTQLVHSALFNYGLGSAWDIVAHGDFDGDGHQDLVAQNQTTGFVDFLSLDANAHLIASAMSNVPVPTIVGGGFFGSTSPGQSSNTLVSQLANGQLDMLGFSATDLVHSDLIANTVGLSQATAVGESFSSFPPFVNNGGALNDNVFLHLADGSVDAIGFSGDFASTNLSMSASFLLPASAGTGSVGQVNPDFGLATNESVPSAGGTGLEGVQTVSQLSNGHLNIEFFDSGYSDSINAGTLYASDLLQQSFTGWHVIDAGSVAHNDLFPIV